MIPGREFLGKSYVDFGVLESVASATGMVKRIPQECGQLPAIRPARRSSRRPAGASLGARHRR